MGLPVTIVRPPGEAVIHPITGENLGAPEVELATVARTETGYTPGSEKCELATVAETGEKT